LFRLFNKERPEIVHLNSSKAGGLGAFSAYLAQVPKVIFTSHGLAYDEDRPYWQRILILVATWFTFFFAHKVILISQTTFERAKRLPLCSTKTELIYNGRSPIELVDSAQARKLLGIASENVHIGAIGELTKNKGYEYLLTAIAKVPRNISNFDLTIIGGGELEEKLSRLQISDVVKLRGFIPDASKYLKAFDIFILPSLKEGLPYVLMEAGQASLATIGSNISGITDVLGKAGILVEPKDTDDIAEAIVKLTANADLRRKLGDELHARSQELFSIEVMVGKIAKLCYE
jgi:glycosyltransferase involved in cell wall biosynthesis